MRKLFLVIVLLLLLGVGLSVGLGMFQMSRTWSGFMYASVDRLYFRHVGDFTNLEQCKAAASNSLHADPQLENGRVADSFICGRACLSDAFVGRQFVDEYQCDDTYDSREAALTE